MRFTSTLILIFSFLTVKAQHNPIFSPFADHWAMSNPAALTLSELSNNGFSWTNGYHDQWFGADLDGRPQTIISYGTYRMANKNYIVGGHLFANKAGAFRTINGGGRFALSLSSGLNIGCGLSLTSSFLSDKDLPSNASLDPLLSGSSQQKLLLNASPGLFYSGEKFLVGAGINFVGVQKATEEVKIAVQMGWIERRDFKLIGSIWYFPNPSSFYIDISNRLYLNDSPFFVGFQASTQSSLNYHTAGFLFGWEAENSGSRYLNTGISIGIGRPFANKLDITGTTFDLKLTFNFENYQIFK